MPPFSFDDLPDDPLSLFHQWYAEAEACASIQYAGAMHLATIGADDTPEGRIVLLQEASAAGFAFMTDARSPKGRAIERQPRVALTFYWGPLERQVRLRGRAAQASDEEADAFFQRRPRRSQVTAWASAQSKPAASRAALETRMRAVKTRFAGRETLPRPPHWHAYRVQPTAVEFWEARAQRLHERALYARTEDDAWAMQRLCP